MSQPCAGIQEYRSSSSHPHALGETCPNHHDLRLKFKPDTRQKSLALLQAPEGWWNSLRISGESGVSAFNRHWLDVASTSCRFSIWLLWFALPNGSHSEEALPGSGGESKGLLALLPSLPDLLTDHSRVVIVAIAGWGSEEGGQQQLAGTDKVMVHEQTAPILVT